jgi:hypothetical protein
MTVYISLGLSILVLIFNVAIFLTIKFNDLKHLDIKVTDVKNNQEKHHEENKAILEKFDGRLRNIEQSQAAMQAICNERHGKTDSKAK